MYITNKKKLFSNFLFPFLAPKLILKSYFFIYNNLYTVGIYNFQSLVGKVEKRRLYSEMCIISPSTVNILQLKKNYSCVCVEQQK